MNHTNTVLAELVVAGIITAQEQGRMTLASCTRRECDLLAPFTELGQFQGLVVERCSTSVGAETAWEKYQLDKDAEALARKRVQFFRASASLQTGLAQRLVDHPVRIENLVGMIVLAS